MRIEKTEQGKTKNGLRYYLFPRTGFGEQIAAVLVQRGANHLFWKGRDGEKICFPQGTAHFIEHKLFQQEWGDTAETVAEITEKTLQKAYACYYTTDEMALICAGDIPLGEVRRIAERVARRETDARVYFPTEDAEIAEKYRACERRLSVPQFQIGCKLPPLPKQDWLKKRMAAGF